MGLKELYGENITFVKKKYTHKSFLGTFDNILGLISFWVFVFCVPDLPALQCQKIKSIINASTMEATKRHPTPFPSICYLNQGL